jgi:hypothetical protein
VNSVVVCESCLTFYGAEISYFSVLLHHWIVLFKMVVRDSVSSICACVAACFSLRGSESVPDSSQPLLLSAAPWCSGFRSQVVLLSSSF